VQVNNCAFKLEQSLKWNGVLEKKKEIEVDRLNMAREFPRRIHVPVESTGEISGSQKS
jgi:hypothetical protein